MAEEIKKYETKADYLKACAEKRGDKAPAKVEEEE